MNLRRMIHKGPQFEVTEDYIIYRGIKYDILESFDGQIDCYDCDCDTSKWTCPSNNKNFPWICFGPGGASYALERSDK